MSEQGRDPLPLPVERRRVDLASARLGAIALWANDEFFGPKERLLLPEAPVAREGEYTDRGKWVDGWETRRRRQPGHDSCIVRLAARGRIREVVVDTAHFRGNQPQSCALRGLALDPESLRYEDGAKLARRADWLDLLPPTRLAGDTEHRFALADAPLVTHVRLDIMPDGGVARLRLHGEPWPDWTRLGGTRHPVDLALAPHGGVPIACSDAFFGDPRNLLLPDPPPHMGEGWETRRRRGPGHDWVVVRLGHRGTIERADVDTTHFVGNHPESCSLEAIEVVGGEDPDLDPGRVPGASEEVARDGEWTLLLPRTRLEPGRVNKFADELRPVGPATHIRLRIYPDGGVARLRIWGRPTAAPA